MLVTASPAPGPFRKGRDWVLIGKKTFAELELSVVGGR